MVKEWIRKILGIDELNNRVKNLEREKAELEGRVAGAETQRKELASAVSESVSLSEISQGVQRFLRDADVVLRTENTMAAMSILEAATIVERYGFERYVAPTEHEYTSQVISIDEFRNNPAAYIHKLSKGLLKFPIGLNFDGINEILKKMFGNIELCDGTTYSNNGCFQFALESLLGYSGVKGSIEATNALVQATELSHLRRIKCGNWIHIDTLDFIANSQKLVQFIADLSDVNVDARKKAITAIEFSRFAYMTALEVVGTTRIGNITDLLDYNRAEETHNVIGEIDCLDAAQQLKLKLKSSMLSEPAGTSYLDVDKILPLKSVERFRRLASEVTSRILASDKARKGLTDGIDKPLEEYSVGEAIVLACYFARNVITQYKKLEDSAREIFASAQTFKQLRKKQAINGKCTDYTGLALHYLRDYLVPMQPDKFKNWKFGVERDNIGDYKHCYIKAIHINPDLTVDVYFLDPTNLANKGIDELKTPKDVIKGVDPNSLPLMIKRDAEDLLYTANEIMKRGGDNTPN